MTPSQLAQAKCANFDQNGCLGATFIGRTPGDDGAIHTFKWGRFANLHERDRCLVLDRQPCDYLNQCVLGVRRQDRSCPGCGGDIGKRRRLCETCAAKKHRESARKHYWKSRT